MPFAGSAILTNPGATIGRHQIGGRIRTESDTVAAGVRKRRPVMKFASFENLLMLATLMLFAVFLVWSIKIIAAWA